MFVGTTAAWHLFIFAWASGCYHTADLLQLGNSISKTSTKGLTPPKKEFLNQPSFQHILGAVVYSLFKVSFVWHFPPQDCEDVKICLVLWHDASVRFGLTGHRRLYTVLKSHIK